MKIFIYISENTKERLKETQKKYHVSISTICQILSDTFKPNFLLYEKNFLDEYLDKEHRTKTTIKPNNITENSEIMQKCNYKLATISHVMSNLLYLFANEKWEYLYNPTNLNVSKKEYEKYTKQLFNEFEKKKEIFWNYNANLRNQVRIVRKNADYFKRILEQ